LQVQLHAQAHNGAGPVTVVEEFCKRDLNGARLQQQTRMNQLVSWEEEPGWDSLAVTKGFRVKTSSGSAGLATVTVEYREYGTLDGNRYQSKPKTELVVFSLAKKRGVWKITAPMIPPHTSPATAIRNLNEIIKNEGKSARQSLSPEVAKLRALK
jgi:hypothetical protein